MQKPQYLPSLLYTAICFREKCRNLFIAVLPQPYQSKPSAFGLNFKRERVSKEKYATYPHEIHTVASRIPRSVWCSRASLFLQAGPLPRALHLEVCYSLSTD